MKVDSSKLYAVSNVGRKCTSYLINIFFAREFTLQEFGEYSSLLQVAMFVVVLANLGFHEYLLVGNNRDTRRVYTSSISMSIFLLCCYALIGVGYFYSTGNGLLFFLALIRAYLDTTLTTITLAFYQKNKDLKKMTSIHFFVILSSIIILLISYSFTFSIKETLTCLVFCSAVPYGYYLVNEIDILGLSGSKIKEILKGIKDFSLATMTVPIYMSMSNLMAAFFLPKEQMAIYQVTISLGNIVMLLSMSIIQSNYPKYLETYENGKLLKEIKKDVKIFILFFIVILIGWLLLGRFFIELVYSRPEYQEVYHLFMMLIFAYLVISIGGIVNVFFVLNKRQKEIFHINVELIVISILASYTLKEFGAIGFISVNIVVYTYSFLRRLIMLKPYIK